MVFDDLLLLVSLQLRRCLMRYKLDEFSNSRDGCVEMPAIVQKRKMEGRDRAR